MRNRTYVGGDELKYSYEDMITKINSYKTEHPESNIIVGADSQYNRSWYTFVLTIAVVSNGKGGIYFYNKEKRRPHKKLKGKSAYIAWKVWEETTLILEMSQIIKEDLHLSTLETHHDLSEDGDSSPHVSSILGMMKGQGLDAHIKPDAFVASGVSNKYTKG